MVYTVAVQNSFQHPTVAAELAGAVATSEPSDDVESFVYDAMEIGADDRWWGTNPEPLLKEFSLAYPELIFRLDCDGEYLAEIQGGRNLNT